MVGSNLHRSVGVLAIGTLFLLPAAASAADQAKQVTFSKDVAPILQAKCQNCHEPGSIAPMSLRTFEETRPWAKSIKQRVATPADAAVAHRPQRRRAEIQERHVAHRRTGRRRSSTGWTRARCRATRPTCRRSSRWRPRCSGRRNATATARPTSIVKSPRIHDAGSQPGSVVAPDGRHPGAHRTALGADGRDPSVQPPGPQDPASLDRAHRHGPERCRSGCASIAAPPAAGATAQTIPRQLVNARPPLMEWAIGKGYDRYRDDTGKLIKPGEKISWDEHIHAAGEDVTAGSELGIWLYPKGQEPKHRSYLIGFTGLKERRGRPRHPAELHRAHRRLHGAEGKHHHHQLPAALPSARQGDAGRGDSARRQHPDHQLRRQLQLQLDDQLHLRR